MKPALGTVKILTFLVLFHTNCRVFGKKHNYETYSEAQIELGKKTAELKVQALRLMKLRGETVTENRRNVEEDPFWGDIQMDEDLLKDLKNSFEEEEKRLSDKNNKIPKGTQPNFKKLPLAKWSMPIKYTITDVYSNDLKQIIRNGLKDIEEKTGCISFAEVQSNPGGSYVQYTERTDLGKNVGGNSPLGRQKSVNVINLASDLGKNYHTVVHETLHTLGFDHTQNRPDRDQYLEMHLENVPKNRHHNFKIWESALKKQGAFDYGSIMIYSTWAFATVDGAESMVPKIDPNFNRGLMNAENRKMSTIDVKILKKIYCRKPRNNNKSECLNVEENSCPYWNDQGYCKRNSKYYSYVSEQCRKTCGLC